MVAPHLQVILLQPSSFINLALHRWQIRIFAMAIFSSLKKLMIFTWKTCILIIYTSSASKIFLQNHFLFCFCFYIKYKKIMAELIDYGSKFQRQSYNLILRLTSSFFSISSHLFPKCSFQSSLQCLQVS